MIFRSLDGTGDWNFGKGVESYARDNNAIAFNVQTRILSFFRDCWFDQNNGIDWFRLLGTKSTKQEIVLSVRGVILQSYGVSRVNSIDITQSGRGLSISYNIDTIFTQRASNIVEVLQNV